MLNILVYKLSLQRSVSRHAWTVNSLHRRATKLMEIYQQKLDYAWTQTVSLLLFVTIQ